jgi:23S rRNA (guanosine2251-2'-O)-methyltransferase
MQATKLSMDELNRLSVNEFKQTEKIPIIVVLENIRSAYNVGSVFRTADAFILEAIYTTGYTPHPPHDKLNKTALGSLESVTTKHFNTANEAITQLREQGFKILAAEQTTHSVSLQNYVIQAGDKYAIIFGNEVTGVEQDTINNCDACIEIPQLGTKHSINIANAASIILWEFFQQLFYKVDKK